MLILSRRQYEKILIGDNITVTIVRIGDETVRIGIDAPKHLLIVRPELLNVDHGGDDVIAQAHVEGIK
jgi:carbon storage regulator